MITVDDLRAICPLAREDRLQLFVTPLNAAMQEFDINTPDREAMFLAQVAHESGGFHYVKELASGQAYEGRSDLGNTQAGDGVTFKGRGLIQITGRSNYEACGEALALDVLGTPALLEEPTAAARSAAWFFNKIGGNDLADRGDFKLLTKRINGGYNGMQERMAYLTRAQAVIS